MTVTAQTLESRVVQVLGPYSFTKSTANISSGVTIGRLPVGAQVLGTLVTVTEAFNASSTNVITVGTDAEYDNFYDADDGAETVGNVFITNTPAAGAVIATEADVKVKYAQTGTAATTGAATVSLLFIGPQRT